MDGINNILVALGFSEYAEGLFDYSAKLAKSLDAQLIVANVINSRDVEAVASVASMGYEVDGDNYVSTLKEERKTILQEMQNKSALKGENLKAIFRVGNPIDELLKIIIEEKIDMVVMGIKGRTDLESVFIGSVAEKMFRRCPVTCISYRDEKNAERLRKRIHLK
ncbi:MAG: universal stress protein [Thermodesulfobacteriota bacterium]|nr:universal stress protein [Thermodesulfobacteriota bacterium]